MARWQLIAVTVPEAYSAVLVRPAITGTLMPASHDTCAGSFWGSLLHRQPDYFGSNGLAFLLIPVFTQIHILKETDIGSVHVDSNVGDCVEVDLRCTGSKE